MCLVRIEDNLNLSSESVAYAESCPETECICNNDPKRWAEQAKLANYADTSKPLPSVAVIPMPLFGEERMEKLYAYYEIEDF